MADIIALLVIAAVIAAAVAYMVKAKRNGAKCIGCPAGGSCPSAAKPPKKKLEGPVIGKKTLSIEGMHCAHCAGHVTKMLNQIDGVSARVDLSKNQAVVSCDRLVSDEVLKEAVEKIGYHVTGIS